MTVSLFSVRNCLHVQTPLWFCLLAGSTSFRYRIEKTRSKKVEPRQADQHGRKTKTKLENRWLYVYTLAAVLIRMSTIWPWSRMRIIHSWRSYMLLNSIYCHEISRKYQQYLIDCFHRWMYSPIDQNSRSLVTCTTYLDKRFNFLLEVSTTRFEDKKWRSFFLKFNRVSRSAWFSLTVSWYLRRRSSGAFWAS
jgi:hypothetical protein